jgi:hypothetical protein
VAQDVAEEFRSTLREALRALEDALVAVLRQLVEHDYPPEVAAVDFEVFSDTWSEGFPARAFFMDESNCEHFIYVDGKAEYPSPVDPALLDVPHVVTPEYADSVFDRDPNLDTFTLGTEEFIPWFAGCWRKAGGTAFKRRATIAEHDHDREFNLVTGQWQDRHAAF